MNYISLNTFCVFVAGACLPVVSMYALAFFERYEADRLLESIVAEHDDAVRSDLYEGLIERVGLIEAQEMLYTSGIPFNGTSHLLNHTAGTYAYTQYGAEGILKCKDYFLQSCYHGFLIEFIAANGIESIGTVVAICDRAGVQVASQCAHGIGHGLLAWVGYKNLIDAFEWCDTIHDNHPTLQVGQCHNGVAMENNWAVHENGAPSPDRWVDPEDPYFPCSDPRIKAAWQDGCWQNQASVMVQLFEGDYAKTYEWCAKVPDPQHRDACLNNLARQIHPEAQGDPRRIDELCSIMTAEDRAMCIARNATAEYSVGGRTLPFLLCDAEDEPSKNTCFSDIFRAMKSDVTPSTELLQLCTHIESVRYQEACANAVLGGVY